MPAGMDVIRYWLRFPISIFKWGYQILSDDDPVLLKRGGGGGTHSLNAQMLYRFLKARKVSISSLASSKSNT